MAGPPTTALNTWFVGPTRVCRFKWHLDQFSRLCTVHLRAKQQTDHAASDVRNNRPHLTVFDIA